MDSCPDCDRPLGKHADKCPCGWKRPALTPVNELRNDAQAADIDRVRRTIEQMRNVAAKRKPSAREHWERVLADPRAPWVARDAAREALSRIVPDVEREAGQDDEESATA